MINKSRKKSFPLKLVYWLAMSLEIILLALAFRGFSSGILLLSSAYLVSAAIIAVVLFRWRRLLGLYGPAFDRATLPPEETNPSSLKTGKPPDYELGATCRKCGRPLTQENQISRYGKEEQGLCDDCRAPSFS